MAIDYNFGALQEQVEALALKAPTGVDGFLDIETLLRHKRWGHADAKGAAAYMMQKVRPDLV